MFLLFFFLLKLQLLLYDTLFLPLLRRSAFTFDGAASRLCYPGESQRGARIGSPGTPHSDPPRPSRPARANAPPSPAAPSEAPPRRLGDVDGTPPGTPDDAPSFAPRTRLGSPDDDDGFSSCVRDDGVRARAIASDRPRASPPDASDASRAPSSVFGALTALALASSCAVTSPPPALAGFGAPTGVVDSPPLPETQLEYIVGLDRVAAIKKARLIRTSNFDILLQELNALTQLDEKALEAADAEMALRISEDLERNIREASASAAQKAELGELSSQRTRLLERRVVEAEFQKKLLQRKVDEARLEKQPQWVVYGAALGASVLSTVVMHPVDTVKVRKQAMGARRLAAERAADLVNDAAEQSALTVAGAAAVAGALAVDAKVAAAAEAGGPLASFDSFDDGPAEMMTLVEETTTGGAAAAAAKTSDDDAKPKPSPPFTRRGDSIVRRATSDDVGDGVASSGAASSVAVAEPPRPRPPADSSAASAFSADDDPSLDASIPVSAALAAVSLTAPRDEIFAPLGVPLTPRGLASLYDGLVPNVVKEGPPLALYLGIYEALKSALLATEQGRDSPVACYLVAGAVGELVGSFLRVPAEAVKSTQQSNAGITLADALRVNFATPEGRAGCARAWTAAVVRDVPFGAIQIALFEAMKIYLSGSAHPIIDGDSALGEAVLGAVGGGVGAFVSAPADVVVTRLIKEQAKAEADEDGDEERGTGAGAGAEEKKKPKEPLNAWAMAKVVYAEGGVPAFFRGSVERVLYWAPAIGIFLTAYCRIRHAALP